MITQQGYVLLRRLQEDGDLPLGELARITQMDPAATGRQVRQLEDDGLVTRTKGADDGRVVVVKVTAREQLCDSASALSGRTTCPTSWLIGRSKIELNLAALLPRFVDGLRGVPFRSSLDETAS